jgi:endonuclease I
MSTPPFSSCSKSSHYPTPHPSTRSTIHSFLQANHLNTIPYSSTKTDVWDALWVLDKGSEPSTVSLIYAQVDMSTDLQAQSTGWNREHLWPKSYGVGYTGSDFSDLHHLRAAGWSVNAARGNKLFGRCLDSSIDASDPLNDDCDQPAYVPSDTSSSTVAAADDTTSDKEHWLPPVDVRGDIARAMFYMDLRYDGDDDPDGVDLQLSNCPAKPTDTVKIGKLGLLDELLRWHRDDPVDTKERVRTETICEDYQGNRNIFIDYPDLVTEIYGEPPPDYIVYNCDGTDPSPTPVDPTPDNPTPDPTKAPTAPVTVVTYSPTPAPKNPADKCASVKKGDVVITAVSSDQPDQVLMLVLDDIEPGVVLKFTDSAYSRSNGLSTNEGVVGYTVASSGLKAGDMLSYGGERDSGWTKIQGDVQLSSAGESILVYCTKLDGDENFISGINVNGGWTPEEDIPEGMSTVSLFLDEKDNYYYTGEKVGTKGTLLSMITTPSNWLGDSSIKWDEDDLLADAFTVIQDNDNNDNNTKMFDAVLAGAVAVLFSLIVVCVAYISCCRNNKNDSDLPRSRYEMTVKNGQINKNSTKSYGVPKATPIRAAKRPSRAGVNTSNLKFKNGGVGGLV